MNKLQATSLSLLALAALPTLSHAGEEIIVIEPVSYAVLSAQDCPWWLEATGFYGFAQNKLFKSSSAAQAGHVNLIGGDLTLGQDFAKSPTGGVSAWDIRFGYGYGSNSKEDGFTDSSGDSYKEKVRLHRFYLMPGYRYTMPLDQSWSAYFGVNLGVDNSSIKSHMTGNSESLHTHNSAWGFAYSAELGLKWDLSKNMYVLAAYEFQGSTSNPSLSYDGESMPTRDQYYHTVRLGLGWKF